ncbi:unnamed protein product [Rotaria socialis]|uniref:Helicase C-terminal domain-containing protein n=1 Tax=Rotaria socialis TaxID=392032 RepID=A0A821PNR9_9BILA|nr:unnamed protein product [Rotaria socialis]
MLNKALRVQTHTIIYTFRSFILDLHTQLNQLAASRKETRILTLYRGQSLSNTDLTQLERNRDGLLSFNNFLSTSTSKDVALNFACQSKAALMFGMNDPKSASIFQSIALMYKEEKPFDIMECVGYLSGQIVPGEVNRLDKLQEKQLIQEQNSNPNVSKTYERIGDLYKNQKQFGLALECCRRIVTGGLSNAPSNREQLPSIYYEIANIYQAQGIIQLALEHLNLAINSAIHTERPDLEFISAMMIQRGDIFADKKQFNEALLPYHYTLECQLKHLPPIHPIIATTHVKTASMHFQQGKYEEALHANLQAIEIANSSLPSDMGVECGSKKKLHRLNILFSIEILKHIYMASCKIKQFCIKCNRSEEITTCMECQQWFCIQHFDEHRQELVAKMDNIEQEHDVVQPNVTEGNISYPFAPGIITQTFLWVEEAEKYSFLLDLLKNQADPNASTLILVGGKRTVEILHVFLENHQHAVTSLHGGRMLAQREEAVKSFRTGLTPILIGTVIAVRGVYIRDSRNFKQIINFDFPRSIDVYVDCIGRTGRDGTIGHAISFFSDENRNLTNDLRDYLRESHQEVPEWLEHLVQETKQYSNHRHLYGGDRVSSSNSHLRVPKNDHHPLNNGGYDYDVQQDDSNHQQKSDIWWDIIS